jgi:hypothetical protein
MPASASHARKSPDEKAAPPGNTPAQQVVTFLLIVHLICIAVALASYTRRSALQSRMLNLFAVYTRTLDLDPYVAPYHISQYDALSGVNPQDDELFLAFETTTDDGETQTYNFSDFGLSTPDSQRRFRAYATEMYYGINSEDPEAPAFFARIAGGFALRRMETDTGVLRLMRHMSQPRLLEELQPGFPPDPSAAKYVVPLYEADILLDNEEVQVIKREPRTQVAPVRAETSRSRTAPASGPTQETHE